MNCEQFSHFPVDKKRTFFHAHRTPEHPGSSPMPYTGLVVGSCPGALTGTGWSLLAVCVSVSLCVCVWWIAVFGGVSFGSWM